MTERVPLSKVERVSRMLETARDVSLAKGCLPGAAALAEAIDLIGELDAAWMTADRECRQKTASLGARIAKLKKALPPAARLRLLADWFDEVQANHPEWKSREVQADLRRWAESIECVRSD